MNSSSSFQPKVFVIHENPEWAHPLLEQLNALQIPSAEWSIASTILDLQEVPPAGIFYSKASASAHTRGHGSAIELAMPLVQWLESHGKRVINGGPTILTEASKARQYQLLRQAGIRIPKTLVANSLEMIAKGADQLSPSKIIVKPNRGGKGLGVRLFDSKVALERALDEDDMDSVDGLFIVQEYIESPKPEIVRMEFIGGKFQYAVSVDTTEGFELCPADACEIPDASIDNGRPHRNKFEILPDFHNEDIPVLEGLLKDQNIDIAGFEFTQDHAGRRFVYDINTNTNYNTEAEQRSGVRPGLARVAEFLAEEFKKCYPLALRGEVS